MNDPEDCENCGQLFYLHIEIKLPNEATFFLCPKSIYKEPDKTKYLTKRERKELGYDNET